MKPFSEWPIDGLIGFILIIVVMAGVSIAPFLKNKKKAQLENGFFYMKPGTSTKVLSSIFVIVALLITYGVSQSGYCPRMTLEENNQNTMMGMVCCVFFWAMAFYFYYSSFLVKIAFNKTEISLTSPLSKEVFLWKNLSELGYNYKGRFIVFEGNKKLYVPDGFTAVEKLGGILDSKFLSIEKPLNAALGDLEPTEIQNKKIYVILFKLSETLDALPFGGFAGVVTAVDGDQLVVQKIDGETVSIPYNLRSLMLAAEYYEMEQNVWQIEIPKTDNFDIIGIYYTTE